MPTASGDITQRQLTVRLPEAALKVARRTAKARGLSVNALVRSLLVALQREDEARALKAMYEQLGRDDDSSVEDALDAQASVARRG